MRKTRRQQRYVFIQAIAIVLLGTSFFCAAEAATLITFDDVSTLDEYAPLGVTFSANVRLWKTGAPSVLDNPFGGPVTVPAGICADNCGPGTGSIFFERPVAEISIYALSGPGSDTLSADVRIKAYNAGGDLVDTAIAESTLQFELLSVAAANITRLDLITSGEKLEAWDNLNFQPVPVPSTILLLAPSLASIFLLRKRKKF